MDGDAISRACMSPLSYARRPDCTAKSKALPIAIGLVKTKRVLIVLDAAFIALMAGMSYFFLHEIFFVLMYTIVPLLAFLGFWIYRSDQKKEFKILSTFCKVIMIVGSASLIFT